MSMRHRKLQQVSVLMVSAVERFNWTQSGANCHGLLQISNSHSLLGMFCN